MWPCVVSAEKSGTMFPNRKTYVQQLSVDIGSTVYHARVRV